jgi:hypothetical protein
MRWRSVGARRQQPDAERLLEELVAAQVLDGVEVALALYQQTEVAAHDVAGGHAGAHRQGRVDVGKYRGERLQEMPDQSQAGGRGEVVVELHDLDRSHPEILQLRSPASMRCHPQGASLSRWGHGSSLRTDLRRGAAFALGSEIARHAFYARRAHQ